MNISQYLSALVYDNKMYIGIYYDVIYFYIGDEIVIKIDVLESEVFLSEKYILSKYSIAEASEVINLYFKNVIIYPYFDFESKEEMHGLPIVRYELLEFDCFSGYVLSEHGMIYLSGYDPPRITGKLAFLTYSFVYANYDYDYNVYRSLMRGYERRYKRYRRKTILKRILKYFRKSGN